MGYARNPLGTIGGRLKAFPRIRACTHMCIYIYFDNTTTLIVSTLRSPKLLVLSDAMDNFGGPTAFGGFDLGQQTGTAFGGDQPKHNCASQIDGMAFGRCPIAFEAFCSIPTSHGIPPLRSIHMHVYKLISYLCWQVVMSYMCMYLYTHMCVYGRFPK